MPKEINIQLSDKTISKLQDLVLEPGSMIISRYNNFYILQRDPDGQSSAGRTVCKFYDVFTNDLEDLYDYFDQGNTEPLLIIYLDARYDNMAMVKNVTREIVPDTEDEQYVYSVELDNDSEEYGIKFEYNTQKFVFRYVAPK